MMSHLQTVTEQRCTLLFFFLRKYVLKNTALCDVTKGNFLFQVGIQTLRAKCLLLLFTSNQL